MQQRFQEYSANFTKDKKMQLTADVPIQNIKRMPVAIVTSDKDEVCPLEQAKWVFNKIKTIDKKISVVRSMSHERFVTSTDEAYFTDLKRSLLIGSQYGSEAINVDQMFSLLQLSTN